MESWGSPEKGKAFLLLYRPPSRWMHLKEMGAGQMPGLGPSQSNFAGRGLCIWWVWQNWKRTTKKQKIPASFVSWEGRGCPVLGTTFPGLVSKEVCIMSPHRRQVSRSDVCHFRVKVVGRRMPSLLVFRPSTGAQSGRTVNLELVRDGSSQAPPQTYRTENSGRGPVMCVLPSQKERR